MKIEYKREHLLIELWWFVISMTNILHHLHDFIGKTVAQRHKEFGTDP